jgi:hypothetical protein
MKDFLEQLAEIETPPPPAEFDRQLHERLNRSLMAQHLLDFAVGAVPWALGHFFRAVVGTLGFTLTGKFGGRPKGDSGSR